MTGKVQREAIWRKYEFHSRAKDEPLQVKFIQSK